MSICAPDWLTPVLGAKQQREARRVKLLYFAWVRQKIGVGEESLALPVDVKTVADVAALLAARGGGYSNAFADQARLRVAVNQTHARFDSPVSDTDEVAFFPPVTGG